MFSTYNIVQVYKDPSTYLVPSPGGPVDIRANRNIIAILDFPNDSDPAEIIRYFVNGNDLTDEIIARQAFFIIQTLNKQESNLSEITIQTGLSPQAPNPAIQAFADAQAAYTAVVAQLRAQQDIAAAALISDILATQYTDAYNAFVAAREALPSSG